MTKFSIDIKQDELDNGKIALLFEIIANAIRNEEMVEQIDGSHTLDTIFGKVSINVMEE